jgi:hypothetical protein
MQGMQRRVSSQRESIQIEQLTHSINRESFIFKRGSNQSQTRNRNFNNKIIWVLFRNPNLLIQSIIEMQQKQDGSLRDILSKLNEMNQVNEFMEETNTFRPSVSSLGQTEF